MASVPCHVYHGVHSAKMSSISKLIGILGSYFCVQREVLIWDKMQNQATPIETAEEYANTECVVR